MSRQHALFIHRDVFTRQIACAMLERCNFLVASHEDTSMFRVPSNFKNYDICFIECQGEENLRFLGRLRKSEIETHQLLIGLTCQKKPIPEEFLALGMDDYIDQSIKFEELQETLRRWGFQPIRTTHELRSVQAILRDRKKELHSQMEKLKKQKLKLEEQQKRPNNTSVSEINRSRMSLELREWALKTREMFLLKRENNLGVVSTISPEQQVERSAYDLFMESQRPRAINTPQILCIANLAPEVTEEQLEALFRNYGEISSISIPKGFVTAKHTKQAIVEIVGGNVAAAIRLLDGIEFRGHKIIVTLVKGCT